MDTIKISRPGDKDLKEMGVDTWPVWEKEVSTFPWSYEEKETCFILKGKANVTAEGGETVEFGPGDLVVFPRGMSCTWTITVPVRKHYKMG